MNPSAVVVGTPCFHESQLPLEASKNHEEYRLDIVSPAWTYTRNKWSINFNDESSDPFQGFTSKAQKDMGFSPTYSTLCHIFSTYSIVVEHKMHYTNVHSKSWHNCSVTSSFYQLNLELQQVETIKKPDSFHLICIAGMKIWSSHLPDSTSKRSLGDPTLIWSSSEGLDLYQHADHGSGCYENPQGLGPVFGSFGSFGCYMSVSGVGFRISEL